MSLYFNSWPNFKRRHGKLRRSRRAIDRAKRDKRNQQARASRRRNR